MFDLTDRTALVTEATGAIGAAIARAMHAKGAVVAISGRRGDMLDALAGQLGARVHVLPCNIADKAAIHALLPAAEQAMGRVDILVNNAGITRDQISMRMIARAAVRGMTRRRFGRIIGIASAVGVGNAIQANYAATAKAGMIAMTKSLAQEVASSGVTVNAIAPGFIQTAMTDSLTDQQRELILARVPAGRLGEPDDIAAGALYLASNEGAYVTGHTLQINGGIAMI